MRSLRQTSLDGDGIQISWMFIILCLLIIWILVQGAHITQLDARITRLEHTIDPPPGDPRPMLRNT